MTLFHLLLVLAGYVALGRNAKLPALDQEVQQGVFGFQPAHSALLQIVRGVELLVRIAPLRSAVYQVMQDGIESVVGDILVLAQIKIGAEER